MAGFGVASVSDLGLRRCPRVHGMAGAGASLVAMTDFSQRRCGFMAMILSDVRQCFRFGDNLTGDCGTVLAVVKILRLFEGDAVFNCGRQIVQENGTIAGLRGNHCLNCDNGVARPPCFGRSYRRMTDIKRP
jgi:hypothetical protein